MDVELQDGALRFRLMLAGLIALLVVLPLAAVTLLDLDARTPLTIAQDTLHDKYGLQLVDKRGDVVRLDSSLPTVSEFSVKSGATTDDVPFKLDGRAVTCSVHVPSDPQSVTATCSG
ncbi:hypothetical protein [Nocardioides conyzicola]|uniref:Uncharacterized protein n=1 Tax=Nocardioides conyzicola TaxID=1651781 RepID=A0ABP8XHE1_9ACTN